MFWTANKETQKDSLPWCCLEHVRINVNSDWKTALYLNVEKKPVRDESRLEFDSPCKGVEIRKYII